MAKRVELVIRGRVQGVGFRPTVYRYAQELGLAGSVRNEPRGVVIDLEGEAESILRFIEQLKTHPPKQAKMESFLERELQPAGLKGFEIVASEQGGQSAATVPADLAACAECETDVADPANRRHNYAFTNCTNCGPRFTIIEGLPYDRERTTMAEFEMCPECRREYRDPSDRRFDAQPNACPTCGPRLRLLDASGREIARENPDCGAPGTARSTNGSLDPLTETVRLLAEGATVAIKGMGGFHLACDARSDYAVRRLRERKVRPAKALAVMFASMAQLREHCLVGKTEEEELLHPARPIVILPRRAESTLSALISPDTPDVGAFLPYTPLHRMLLDRISPLVMTSGNVSEEPVARNLEELTPILGPIADYALDHDRVILRRCDDSVLRIVRGRTQFIRRSRGYVPNEVSLPLSGPCVLAVGPDLKNTFCITRGDRALMSQHIGDLEDFSTNRFHRESVADWQRTFALKPEIIAHDMHPDYHSTRLALALPGRHVAVQHHHAHVASCMADNGLNEPVIGVALDGTGYGTDGTIWGGEFLVADLKQFRRAAHFRQVPLPGGEEAVRHPARMALAYLVEEFGPEAPELELLADALPGAERALLAQMVTRRLHSPMTSSAGRLFDAVAALVGLNQPVSYEGQAAIRLQAMAAREAEAYEFELRSAPDAGGARCSQRACRSLCPQRAEDSALHQLDFGPMIRHIAEDLRAGRDRRLIAGAFHRTLAEAVARSCVMIREREKLEKVTLSGGVFQNSLLLELTLDALAREGFQAYFQTQVPPNDGGMCLGQAAVALAQCQ